MICEVLVTGGAGFIGANLCRSLVNDGNKVICVDNLSTGSMDNIKDLIDNKNFMFLKDDICDVNLYEHLGEFNIGTIYNLACVASVRNYMNDPLGTIRANTVGVMTLLQFALNEGCHVVHTSSSEVYGDPIKDVDALYENYTGQMKPDSPRACYSIGKGISETICHDYMRLHPSLCVRIVRPFNIYGPGMDKNDDRVIPSFVNAALVNERLVINGTGNQTRSFCYIDDAIEAIRLVANIESRVLPITFNVGNPHEQSINDIAFQVLEEVDSNSEIVFDIEIIDDPNRRKPDISLIKEITGWRPTTNFDEGLRKTIESFDTL